jgi:hypothetical protein
MFYYVICSIFSLIVYSQKNKIIYNSLFYYDKLMSIQTKNNIYIEKIQNNTIKKYDLNTVTNNDLIILNIILNNHHKRIIIEPILNNDIIMASIMVSFKNTLIEHEITNELNSFLKPNTILYLDNNNNKQLWLSILNNKFSTKYDNSVDFIYTIILQNVCIYKSNTLLVTINESGDIKIDK